MINWLWSLNTFAFYTFCIPPFPHLLPNKLSSFFHGRRRIKRWKTNSTFWEFILLLNLTLHSVSKLPKYIFLNIWIFALYLRNFFTLDSWIIVLARNMFLDNFQRNTLLLQSYTIILFWAEAAKKFIEFYFSVNCSQKTSSKPIRLCFGYHFVLKIQRCILCLNMYYVHLPIVLCIEK